MRVKILYEDDAILVIHKPAGFPVQTRSLGAMDCVSELKNYLRGEKKQEPYLGIVHRLDQPVEGLMVFAKTPKAAADLSRHVQGNDDSKMVKCYEAVVVGTMPAREGTLKHYLKKEEKGNHSHVTEEGTGGKLAILEYEVVEEKQVRDQNVQTLRIHLKTGRHHQIRVQLSHMGAPILGDQKYGSQEALLLSKEEGVRNLRLRAVRLELVHPVTKKPMCWSLDEDT